MIMPLPKQPTVTRTSMFWVTMPSGHRELLDEKQMRQLSNQINDMVFAGPIADGPVARELVNVVAEACGLTEHEIMFGGKEPAFAFPRQIAMRLIRQDLRMSFQRIGRMFHKDHGTVIHAIDAVQKRMDTEPVIARLVADISAKAKEKPNGSLPHEKPI